MPAPFARFLYPKFAVANLPRLGYNILRNTCTTMSGNRFDFLEIGEGAPAPPPEPSYEPDLATPADAPAPRALDGTPLAQVRITDPRGYGCLDRRQDLEAVLALAAPRAPTRLALRLVEVFGERGARPGSSTIRPDWP